MLIKKQPYESEAAEILRWLFNVLMVFVVLIIVSLLAIGAYHLFI